MVAYALAGTIRFDIEKDSLGNDSNGKPIYLSDLWPSDAEIDAVVGEHVKPQQFQQIYVKMFQPDEEQVTTEPLYDWRPQSTYIRRPPYWEGALAGERSLSGMRPLAIIYHLQMRFSLRVRQVSTWRKWKCQKKTLTLMRLIEVIT
mgnify:CR=1 FL=1